MDLLSTFEDKYLTCIASKQEEALCASYQAASTLKKPLTIAEELNLYGERGVWSTSIHPSIFLRWSGVGPQAAA